MYLLYFSDLGICRAYYGRLECLIPTNQRFLALDQAGASRMAASLLVGCRRLTIDQQSAAALVSLSSSYGFVGVPARNADLAGPLVLRIREKETDAPDRERPGEESAGG